MEREARSPRWTPSYISPALQGRNRSPDAIWRLGAATFIAGPLVCVVSLLAIWRYPITRQRLGSLLPPAPAAGLAE